MSIDGNPNLIAAPAAVDVVTFPWPMHTYGPPFQHLAPGLPDHPVMFKKGKYYNVFSLFVTQTHLF